MTTIVGVRFHQAGKIYYFDPIGLDLEVSSHVIVETARGVEMGTVLIAPKEVEDDKVIQPLKPIMRQATDEDERTVAENKERAQEALTVCREKVAKHELDMKLVGAEYTFDRNKLLFYFTADGRIDFRELVKDLAAVFRTRIELRQIGVRDETKLRGGIGMCGRPLCCSTYLSDFVPVSIKMAKEQGLSLNPTKISGMCGRLMCCLKNEQDTYEYLNSRMPSVGEVVTASDGTKGEVSSVSVLRQTVKIVVDTGSEKELREYPVDALRMGGHRRKDVKVTEEEERELAALEDEGSTDALDAIEEPKKKQPKSNHSGRKNDRTDRNDRSDRNDRVNKNDRGNRNDRARKYESMDKNESIDKNGYTDQNMSADQNERAGKNDSSMQGENSRQENQAQKNRSGSNGRKRNYDRNRRNGNRRKNTAESAE